MKSLDELKEAVEDIRMLTDAIFFRSAVGEMLNRLGFFIQDDRYEYYFRDKGGLKHAPPPGFINTLLSGFASAKDIAGVEKAKEHYGDLIDAYVFRQIYQDAARNLFSVAVHHATLEGLKINASFVYTLTSPAVFEGFEFKSIADMCEQEPDEDVEVLLNKAFDEGFIGRGFDVLDDSGVYFYTPQILYKLLTQKKDS